MGHAPQRKTRAIFEDRVVRKRPQGWPPGRNGMPSLARLESENTLEGARNVIVWGKGLLPPPGQHLLANLTRLTDKAILEYELARESIDRYLDAATDQPQTHLYRTFDHLETCLDAVHRAARHAERLRRNEDAPSIDRDRLPRRWELSLLRDTRDAIQHAEEDVLRGTTGADTGRPVSLVATDTAIVAGESGLDIPYEQLARWIVQYHDLVRELISLESEAPESERGQPRT
jgi:hypothetical protein